MKRPWLFALLSCLVALTAARGASAIPPQNFSGIGLSFYTSNTTALAPGGTAGVEYGDVYGGQIEYDGLFKKDSSWGYYGAGSFGTGSEKFTGSATSLKGTFTDYDFQVGVLWTALFIQNWYLGYGPAFGYWSGKLKEETSGGSFSSSETGSAFNSYGVGGRFAFGSSCSKQFGIQGSMSNFIGWGSGKEAGNKFEENNHRWQYCIGARYTF
jgi:hypothetical protein